jgi:Ufm1-specific protease 2
MIGGGVLAYTLLGVAVPLGSTDFALAQFLILDPHYLGPDDVGVILSQGWCKWRDRSIFRKDAFYNFCVPLIPNRV